MRSREIGNINEAILVLKHFIDLSARLLPFLHELETKNKPTPEEYRNKMRIREVYESYEFDPSTSKILLNSDVLELIKSSFNSIIANRRCRRNQTLTAFMQEYERLKSNWEYIESN
jgi:hypothetical protein